MVLSNKMSSFRLGVLFFATLIEMTIFSSPLLGWSSLVFVLKAEGIYSHLCYDNHNSNISKPKDHFSRRFADKPCVEQEERLNFDATLSVLIGAIYIFICGWAIDRFGVKAVKIFSSVMYGISAGFFAITSAESPAMLIPALLVFTIGQVGVFLSAIRSVVLYGKWQASVNSVFCCSLGSSAVLFLIFKVLYEQGIAYQFLWYGFLCSCIVLVFNAVVLFPNIKNNELSGLATTAKDTKEKLMKKSPPNQKKGIWPKLAALKDLVVYMKSLVFIGSCLFIGICRLRLWFFMISFQQFMMALPKVDEESVKSYANYYGMTQLCSVAVGPFVSALITATAEMFKRSGSYKQHSTPRLSSPQEKLGKTCKCEVLGVTDAEETARAGEVRGCTVYFAFSGILFVLISSLTTIPNAPLQILSFVLITLLRCLYTGGFANLFLVEFPIKHFGKIYGIGNFLTSLVQMLQYPVFVILENYFPGKILQLNIALLILSLPVTVGFPCYLWQLGHKMDIKAKSPKTTASACQTIVLVEKVVTERLTVL